MGSIGTESFREDTAKRVTNVVLDAKRVVGSKTTIPGIQVYMGSKDRFDAKSFSVSKSRGQPSSVKLIWFLQLSSFLLLATAIVPAAARVRVEVISGGAAVSCEISRGCGIGPYIRGVPNRNRVVIDFQAGGHTSFTPTLSGRPAPTDSVVGNGITTTCPTHTMMKLRMTSDTVLSVREGTIASTTCNPDFGGDCTDGDVVYVSDPEETCNRLEGECAEKPTGPYWGICGGLQRPTAMATHLLTEVGRTVQLPATGGYSWYSRHFYEIYMSATVAAAPALCDVQTVRTLESPRELSFNVTGQTTFNYPYRKTTWNAARPWDSVRLTGTSNSNAAFLRTGDRGAQILSTDTYTDTGNLYCRGVCDYALDSTPLASECQSDLPSCETSAVNVIESGDGEGPTLQFDGAEEALYTCELFPGCYGTYSLHSSVVNDVYELERGRTALLLTTEKPHPSGRCVDNCPMPIISDTGSFLGARCPAGTTMLVSISGFTQFTARPEMPFTVVSGKCVMGDENVIECESGTTLRVSTVGRPVGQVDSDVYLYGSCGTDSCLLGERLPAGPVSAVTPIPTAPAPTPTAPAPTPTAPASTPTAPAPTPTAPAPTPTAPASTPTAQAPTPTGRAPTSGGSTPTVPAASPTGLAPVIGSGPENAQPSSPSAASKFETCFLVWLAVVVVIVSWM